MKNISPVSFSGTYVVSNNNISNMQIRQINSKLDKFEITLAPGNYNHPELIYFSVPDEFDKKAADFFKKIKLKFEKLNCNDALTEENITGRMCLSDDDKAAGRILQTINIKKFDSELKKDKERYVGYKGTNGSSFRYERFKKYLMTNQEINAPSVYVQKNHDGSSQVIIYNGRHRFAVLRDMGLKNIPVAISKEDAKLVKEMGLV